MWQYLARTAPSKIYDMRYRYSKLCHLSAFDQQECLEELFQKFLHIYINNILLRVREVK